VALAGQYGVAIEYDEVAQSPHFSYTGRSGRQHEVWFEDARSIEQKLLLVNEYGLQGIGYWSLMRPFPQNWAVLNSLYDVETLF
jgi:spore germination protein